MGRSLIINCVKLKLIVPILVLQILHTEVMSNNCPVACKCVFNFVNIEDNEAVCRTGNSVINFDWEKFEEFAALTVTCKGTHYNCSDIPQFDVQLNTRLMSFKSCSPSILRCADKFHQNLSLVNTIRLQNSIGTYTKEDFKILDKLWVKTLLLQEGKNDNVSHLPAGIFSDINTLNSLEIEGKIFEHTHMTSDVFTGLYLLKHLRLCSNNLKSIEPAALSNLTNLQTLIIEKNMLQFLPNKLFDKLKNLKQIKIIDNLVNMSLDTHAFAQLQEGFEIVHVENSKITELPEAVFSEFSRLNTITFIKNSIEVLPFYIFWETRWLREIDFSYNQIKEFPVDIFSYLDQLEKINFSYNNIETLNGDLFSINENLKEVRLQNNNIKHIDLDIFKKTKLQTLSLASNKLERIVRHISSSWDLRQLILSDNNINQFEDWLTELNNLEYLDLSRNKINKIKESLVYIWNSVEIDLRNNNITNIEKSNSGLPQPLATNRNVSIYLSNNPFECDCISNIILKHWYDRGWVPDYKEIVCADGEYFSKIDVYQECNKDNALVVSVGTKVIGGLVITIIIISIYNSRKQMWEYINDLCPHDPNNTIEIEERREAIKKYDIYISFAHQDSEIVTDKLLPKLEYEYGQKVYVHYRDRIVGDLISNQIIQSVKNSTKVIIILSRHFLVSEWSQLEFRTAYNLSEQEGRSRVIVIMLDETILVDENLDKDVKTYISLNTYLMWCDPNFWTKLKTVLPKSRKDTSRRRHSIRSNMSS